MKHLIFSLAAILFSGIVAWGSTYERNDPAKRPQIFSTVDATNLFQKMIPAIARQFIGLPYELGGTPHITETSDNSSLFYAIYSQAAQEAGLAYRGYMPMENLLEYTVEVDENDLRNGDLIVLDDQHAAMIYHVDPSGRIYMIYASEKQQRILSFHSDNLVFSSYWLGRLKGFYRLSADIFRPEY